MRVKTDATARSESQDGAHRAESHFRKVLYVAAAVIVLLLVALLVTLLMGSAPALKAHGLKFVSGRTWDPVAGEFGAMPFLVGTLLTSCLALLISLPFCLAISIFLGEYFREGPLSSFLTSATDLLAGIPSVIYGFWGLFVLVPLVRSLEIKMGIPPYGVGVFTSALVLAVMIIPYAASLGREVIHLVPSDLKEAALSLGATRFEMIRKVVLPYARSGILAGIVLALGRAIGETMAVTMVIGNSNFIPKSIFSPGNTMASLIANEFAEATEKIYVSSLVEIALLLFVVTTIINMIGRHIINKTSIEVRV
jgi:phosphate transport system permease protein